MRNLSMFLLFLVSVSLFVLPVLAFSGAPPLSSSEIANVSATEVSAINQEASWFWQLLINDHVAKAINWLLSEWVYILVGWLGLKGTRLAQCIVYIAAGVRAIYASFVRPAKQASLDGKLSEHDRVKAMDDALAYAKDLASKRSIDLFKYLSKDIATTIAELFVRIFKGGGKKPEVLVPLPDSPPLPSSVTQGMKSA